MHRGQWRARCQKKQKKCSDQRAPVNRYYLIKDSRSLDIKYDLVTGRLPSIANYTIMADIFTRLSVFDWPMYFSDEKSTTDEK